MSYSVAKVKTFLGREGHGYNCLLLRDGTVVAAASDMADGGDIVIDWKDRTRRVPVQLDSPSNGGTVTYNAFPEQGLLMEFCRGKEWVFDNTRLDLDPHLYVGDLVCDFLTKKKIAAACKKKTCFRLKDDPKDEYRTFSVTYTKEVQDAIKARYGDNLEVIYNESLFGGGG